MKKSNSAKPVATKPLTPVEQWKMQNARTRLSREYMDAVYGGDCSIAVAAALLEMPYSHVRRAISNRSIPFLSKGERSIRISPYHLAVFCILNDITPTTHLVSSFANSLTPPRSRNLPGDFSDE